MKKIILALLTVALVTGVALANETTEGTTTTQENATTTTNTLSLIHI